jgi:uncharacterized membrane protein
MQPRWKLYTLACSYVLGLLLCMSAGAQTFTTIDYPGSPGSFATDISDCGQIVGEYQYGSSFGTQRYGYAFSNGIFAPVIFPGASWTRAVAINCNGDIVGDYIINKSRGVGQELGYLLRAGLYTTIQFPVSDSTIPAGINTNGDIVGWYHDKVGQHGFLLRAGVYSSIDFPGSAAFTQAWKINDSGEIAGTYIGTADGKHHMFVLSNGTFTPIPDVPDSYETAHVEDGGLNNLGDLASNYCSGKPCSEGTIGNPHGFLLSNGVYTTFDYPGSTWTIAFGINSPDIVVGAYLDSNGMVHGYIRTP